MPSNNKGVVHEKFFGRENNQLSGRFEVPDRSSLVGITPQTGGYERVKNEEKKGVGRPRVELGIPAMSRRYPNQARPPAQYTMKKFIAQIYVVDRLCQANY